MKKSIILLILIFLLLGVVAIFYILTLSKINISDTGEESVLKIKNDCEGLSGKECYNRIDCIGSYGPSFCSGGTCTADLTFKRCGALPKEKIEQAKIDKKLCNATSGKWIENTFANGLGRCDCLLTDNSPRFEKKIYEIGRREFVDDKGCINEIIMCNEIGGIWKIGKKYTNQIMTEEECDKIAGAIFQPHESAGSTCKIYVEENFIARDNTMCLLNGVQVNPFE